jgi:hypothetical protein
MTDFVIYILKSALALSIFYLLYFLLFRKETFFHFNRIYILVAMVISFIIPALNIQMKQPASHVENNFSYVNHAFLDFSETVEFVKASATEKVASVSMIPYLLILGMLIALVRVGYQLFSIYKKVIRYEIKKHRKYTYVLIDQHQSTHSFFNYIFVQKSEFKKKRMKEVLLHEQIHVDQGHSIDLLFIGFLSILQWFNPFIYLFKRALVETHEFQADQAVIGRGIDRNQYQRLLLEHARSVVMTGLTSSFNQSIIKNRLKMMNKIKSSNKAIIKYLMVFPVVFFVGIVFAVSQEKMEESISELMTNTKDGPITGFSDFVSLDFTSSLKNIKSDGGFYYDLDNKMTVFSGKEVNGETDKGTFSVKADNIIFYENESRIIGFTDDYVPSISPIDNKDLKRAPSGFGMRMHPILKVRRMHNGMDFSAPLGTEIYATANGHVRSAELAGPYGNRVIIDHGNEFSTSYCHMQKCIVKEGQSLKKGDLIGYVGNTGLSAKPHLHYEVMKDGKYVDPADYLGQPKE